MHSAQKLKKKKFFSPGLLIHFKRVKWNNYCKLGIHIATWIVFNLQLFVAEGLRVTSGLHGSQWSLHALE